MPLTLRKPETKVRLTATRAFYPAESARMSDRLRGQVEAKLVPR